MICWQQQMEGLADAAIAAYHEGLAHEAERESVAREDE
jgi:hypothetical protein